MSNNKTIFNDLSKLHGHDLKVDLSNNFNQSYNDFRKLVSKDKLYNSISYKSVFFSDTSYAGVTFIFDNIEVKIFVNLEYYYVYGFYFDDGTVYAFDGEASHSLQSIGLKTEIIPYRDDYNSIIHNSKSLSLSNIQNEIVTSERLHEAFLQLSVLKKDPSNKSNDILVFLWSCIEGIRFQSISNIIHETISSKTDKYTYGHFLLQARNWANLSVYAAKAGILIPQIAIYDLNRLIKHRHTGE